MILAKSVIAGALAIAVFAFGAVGGAAKSSPPGATARSLSQLAHGCFILRSAGSGLVVAPAGKAGYRSARAAGGAARFTAQPTGLGTFLLYDAARRMPALGNGDRVTSTDVAGPSAQVRVRQRHGVFSITFTANNRGLWMPGRGGRVSTLDATSRGRLFDVVRAGHCRSFPEAGLDATGKPFSGKLRDGSVFGFADTHLHITANFRAGGMVISGEPFDRFGIPQALGHDDVDHGPDGSLDLAGNLLRDGKPTGTHDINGWPTFTGWPVHDTITHQQTYYVWLKRMWMAGERLVVAQTVEDTPICSLAPMTSHSCDETETVKLEIANLRQMQKYIDAQSGGKGRGWFQIAETPKQARSIIQQGKLAVVIGVESSDPFGCSEKHGVPDCTQADIDRVLDDLYSDGVRTMFLAHWVDNALAGPAFEGGAKGDFISLLNTVQTGDDFATEPCTTGDEDNGTCNARGLTDLGRYTVTRMMDKHMLIEVDHLSQKAREAVLEMAEARHYPLVSSHTGTGGEWTPSQLQRLYALGGIASSIPRQAPDLASRLLEIASDSGVKDPPVALGTDTGGLSSLPGPSPEAATDPLSYPFRSYDGKVKFTREKTGTRTFDLNTDGVAHYGLFADLLAEMGSTPQGKQAMKPLFRSAEGYLDMWGKAVAAR